MAAARVDVPRLLAGLGIEATRRGNRWHAKCPDHVDRKPSWAILDEPNDRRHARHRCLSCGFHGDAVELVRIVFGLATRMVARVWLEENALVTSTKGLPLTVEIERASPLRAPFRMPDGFVEIATPEHAKGIPGEYLTKTRGVPVWQAMRWRLGFALDGRLRGRVVFPIRDLRGRLLAYTARSHPPNESAVRYLTPKASEGADPGAIFGEEFWPFGLRRRLYLAEGALKVLAIERALADRIGVREVMPEGTGIAAVGGANALTIQKYAKLGTWLEVVIVQDGNLAGERFSEELLGGLGRLVETRVVPMPKGKDPDDLDPLDLAGRLGADPGIRPSGLTRAGARDQGV